MGRIKAGKGIDVSQVIVVARRCRKGLKSLRRVITLPGLQLIVGRNTPASEQAPDQAVLFLEEWQVLGDQDRPGVRVIQTGEGVFTFPVNLVRRILRKKRA